MWVPTIDYVKKEKGQVVIRIKYTNGEESFTEDIITRFANSTWLQQQVRERVKALTASYAFADGLSPNDTVDVSDASSPAPAQVEQEAWLTDFGRLQRAQKLVDLGVIQASNAKFQALLNKVKTGIKPEYIDII